ncbi:hypothetical protein [Prescottella agglutinans]|uniref:Uncharacterized protein n=1 Tax=Prescottella agglutinans TaxID=1644129 RepID=A0ABT6MGR5_9NOCA|nr:hypothetical protein [Prescottella agglutinans]MDH6283515.1 hypothetical protein [Prescottella agglutinans]
MDASRILVGMAAVALLSGCSSPDVGVEASASPTPQDAVPGLAEPTCLAANLLGFSELPQSEPPAPDQMPIPAGFAPTRVVTCEGDWNAGVVDHTVSWVEEHRAGNMDAVLAGYALPSEPRELQTCTVDQMSPPIVWLVDDLNMGMRAPELPTGECGAFKWDAITAIRALPLTERIVHRVPVSPEVESHWGQ